MSHMSEGSADGQPASDSFHNVPLIIGSPVLQKLFFNWDCSFIFIFSWQQIRWYYHIYIVVAVDEQHYNERTALIFQNKRIFDKGDSIIIYLNE